MAKGDFLVNISDDESFSDGFLGHLESYINKVDTDKMFFTFRYKVGGVIDDNRLWYEKRRYGNIMIGIACCIKKKIWHEVGGIDRRFSGTMYDVDLHFRYREKGMRLFITPKCIIEEISYNRSQEAKKSLFGRTGKDSRKLLRQLWPHENNHIILKRSCPVKSFSDDNILFDNQ
jgi:GT2 family glycosyltransferase